MRRAALLLFWFALVYASVSFAKGRRDIDDSKNSYSFGYSVGSDLVDREAQRTYVHQVSARYVGAITNKSFYGLGFSAQYKTIDNAIARDSEKENYFDFQDIDISLGQSSRVNGTKWKLLFVGGGYVPASEKSQYEGYKGLVYGYTSLQIPFLLNRYKIYNDLTLDYLVNTYYYSPVTEEINPDFSTSYKLGQSLIILPNVYVSLSLGFKATRHLDGFWKYNYGNTESIVYDQTNYSIALSYTNAGYNDRGEMDLWFIDRRHKRVRLSAVYRF